jgi:nucleoside-diphosphate-sugar epimerase
MMFHFASGAEFDRKNHINCFEEGRIFDSMPEDFYGLSKNMIARKIVKHKTNIYNFRLFGCFGKHEEDNRLLKILSKGIRKQSDTFIEGSKTMDFFYDVDVCRAIEFYMDNYKNKDLPRDVNLVYEHKFTIKEISNYLEEVLGESNENLKLNEITTNSYTGDWKLCSKTFPEDLFIGLKQAISQIYSVEG